jgi:hypothetical protein
MVRAFGWLTFTTFALLAVFVGGLKLLGWSGGELAAMAALVVIWVVMGAGVAMSDYLGQVAAVISLGAIGATLWAVVLAADGIPGSSRLLALAASTVVCFAAGIGCGWQFAAEPDLHPTGETVPDTVPLDWTR